MEITNNGRQAHFKKNKKKKSKFLQNAKGFAKQGIYGRGAYIEVDEYKYFINVMDAIKSDFEDIESKVNMANNVFEQTKGREVYLASNQIVCKVMESLLGFIDADKLEAYFEVFADSFRPICSDCFASHVLQKMVEIAFLRCISVDKMKKDDSEIGKETKVNDECDQPLAKKLKVNKDIFGEENYNLETKFTQEHKTNCGNFVLRVGKFMLNNLEDFVWDPYASHIMRTCLLYLAGIYVPKVPFVKATLFIGKNRKMYEVSSEWQNVCKEFAQRLELWPQFSDLPYKESSSSLLGTLCFAIQAIDKKMLKYFANKIFMEALLKSDADEDKKVKDEEKKNKDSSKREKTKGSDKPILAKVFQHKSSLVLLETLMIVARPKLLTQIYSMLFINKLALLAKEPTTSFVVTKLVANIPEKEDFENIFEELKEHIEELLQIGHTGIVTSLSTACLRLQTKQAQLIAALLTALHLSGEKERLKSFFLCLIKLKPFEIAQEDETTFVHLQGSLLIQDLLRFNKPIFLVNCILETPTEYLVTVFSTPNGSHICDHYLQSKFIGEKSRDKLIKQFEGFYVDLAISKWGSRVLESCFASAQDAQKEKIVKELAHKLNILKSTPFGEIIIQKLRLDTYRLSVHQWKASLQRKESKATSLFKNIIN